MILVSVLFGRVILGRMESGQKDGLTARKAIKIETSEGPMAKKKAFTLIELLVVIAIIGILLAALVPALQVAKAIASGAVCLANLSALNKTWYLYQEENDLNLVGLSNYYSGGRATPYRWVERPLYRDTDKVEKGAAVPPDSEINLEYQLAGLRAGKLYSYTGTEKVYHCPNDKYWKTRPEGPWISYAGSGCMNSEDFVDGGRLNNNIYNPIRTSYYRQVIIPSGQTKSLVVVTKFNEIKAPADRFTFVEEDYIGIKNQIYYRGGFVLMNGGNYWTWWDWPAWYHNGRSTLGFADGHAEKHDWKDKRTLDIMKLGTGAAPLLQPDNEDIEYMNKCYVPAGW